MIDPKSCCQVGIVTRNLEKTAAEFCTLFGVSMPKINSIPSPDISHTTFKGRPTATRAQFCCFDMGQLVLELLEPDEQDSSYKEVLGDDKEMVFHHIGFKGNHTEEDRACFEQMGCPVRQAGEYPGGAYMLVDTLGKYGVYLNLGYKK